MLDTSEAARHLALLPRSPHPVTCVVCGTTFETLRSSRRYCSERCKHQMRKSRQWAARGDEERAHAYATGVSPRSRARS